MEPPVDLERFATLSAELDAGTHRDELCAREGISLADWNASQEAWLSRLAEETARKRFVLTNRYNNAFVARRRALTHGPRFKPAAAKKAEPAAPPPVEIAPPPPVVVSLPALYREAEAPPLYRESEPPVYRESEPPLYREPEPPPRRIEKAPTMSMPAYTEPVAAPLPFAPAPDADVEGSAVSGASPLAQSRTALPFKALALPELEAPPLARTVDAVDTGTLKGASPGAALPFQRAVPPAVAPPAAVPAAPAAAPPGLDGGSTVYGLVSPFAAQASALPFQGGAPAPAPRNPLAQSSMGLPFQARAAPAAQAAPAAPTAPAPAAPAPPAGSPAARPSPSAQGTTRLTLEQFASLTAEIAVNPRAVAQIRARYGFDEASHRAEAEEHNRRFAAEPALYARYMELFQSYREWVARTPR